MTTKPDALIDLIKNEIKDFEQARRDHSSLFPPDLNLYPIPFFGRIQQAEVLTIALNPSWMEFKDRNWPAGLDAHGLADRLLDYFDLWEAEPHPWFEKCHPALSLLGRSYQCDAAHVDIVSHPTFFLRKMSVPQKETFAEISGRSLERLREILKLCRHVKLVIVIDFQFPVPGGETTTTFEFLENRCDCFTNKINGNGGLPPTFRGGGVSDLAQRVRQHRKVLRECLQVEQFLEF